ncbi:hypothetical protein E1B28_001143 [Marasmius oreades]|uniref:N-alpha-acetyltransferase 40 n=1 Tax=Marasmius oreades TaxID=181124 RepID=A0A9P8AF45_9AGAR|nr:uncharacterized protein E1B28_001143 [Marasmius oreades]KAG7099284.1 hypothetical protein E1B28_001143 [Marasmius oreades]
MSATGSRLVRLANAASGSELQHESQKILLNNTEFQVCVLHADDLPKVLQESVWEIFEQNMYQLYLNSASGWNRDEKRAEFFNSLSRFIVLSARDTTAAYAIFRFEYEEGLNLLYCYELQTQKFYQKKGLGKFLMNALDSIARKWKMDQIMLTVFKDNVNASRFYKDLGFGLDPTSPTDEDGEDLDAVDYEILSKPARK